MHLLHKTALASALLTLSGFALIPASAQNLVTNPGFETGDFTGWDKTPFGDLVVVSTFSPANESSYPPHSGVYSAQFASSALPDDVLSQRIATSAGKTYIVSFWLANATSPFSAPMNDWKFSFGGNPLLDIENAGDFPYTYHQFAVAATDATTLLTFSGRTPPGTFYLDDISVTAANPVPEASSVVSLGVLLTLGLGGMALRARRRKAASAR